MIAWDKGYDKKVGQQMSKPYILAIGDIVTDAFIKLRDDKARIDIDENGEKRLSMEFGSKPPYDHVDIVQAVGPSPNAAVAFARLGLHSGLMAYLGDDLPGKESLDYLKQQNVDTSTMSIQDGLKSNYWYVLRYGAERTILVKNELYDYSWQEPTEVPGWIYLSALDERSWDLHMQTADYLAKHPEVKLVFQPGTFHFEWGAKKLAEIYARTYMLCLNKEEAAEVANLETTNIEELAAGLHNLGPEIVVITDGPHGSYASDGRKIVSIPNYPDPAPPLDRTGAGDAFASTIVSALALGENLETAMTWAPINSAFVCQQIGAQAGLQTRDQILEHLKNAPADYVPTIIAGDNEPSIEEIAKQLVEKPKGIFAADESGGSIGKRFEEHGIEFSEENRRLYRQLFLTAPDIEKYVSGVILFDETARQRADNGTLFPELLASKGIIPGIKVDKGIELLPGFDGEGVTSGLDGLGERLKEYREMGLRFAKWRAALTIGDGTPSDAAIAANVHTLARYALACQNADIVPIVEPEIIHAGNYDIETSKRVTAKILDALFDELALLGVNRKAIILKTGMVLAGSEYEQSQPSEVAHVTVETLKNHVPHDVAGVVFLSGGQGVEQATDNLQAITDLGNQAWPITFSYARALQEPAIAAWKGKAQNVEAAQNAFLDRLEANSNATIQAEQLIALHG